MSLKFEDIRPRGPTCRIYPDDGGEGTSNAKGLDNQDLLRVHNSMLHLCINVIQMGVLLYRWSGDSIPFVLYTMGWQPIVVFTSDPPVRISDDRIQLFGK